MSFTMATSLNRCFPIVDTSCMHVRRVARKSNDRFFAHSATYGLFIDGQQTKSSSASTFEVENPATGEAAYVVAEANVDDVDRAVNCAKHSFEAGKWRSMHVRERARILNTAASILRSRLEDIAIIESRSTGRAIREMKAQLGRVPEWLEYFAALAQAMEGRVPPFSDKDHLNYVTRVPLGVCGLITPWNHPLLIATKKVSPALATGNSIVVKPSELAPVTPIILAEILTEAGVPDGVINVIPGSGAVTGKHLAQHRDISMIDVTGGTETGKQIGAHVGKNLGRLCAELGGNAPLLVFDDVDVDATVNGCAFAAFVASGQTCVSAKRILVHQTIIDAFTEKFVQKARSIRLGDPLDPETQMGSLISGAHLHHISTMVQTAKGEGATVCCGGKKSEDPELSSGHFFEPTVITNVHPRMEAFQDEIFGPVVTITPFADESEAIRLANDNRFGLGAGIWTRDIKRAHRTAHNLKAGVIWVNAHHRNDPSSPWGGFGESGLGRENGWEAMHEYTDVKSVVVNTDDTPFDWFGGSKRYS